MTLKSHIVLVLWWVLIACAAGLLPHQSCYADADTNSEEDSTDFTKFSLEELKDVVIVSASKKPEMVSGVAAAVYVITQEDIRRSGVTSIPEALRLAPGVHVARITATDWAINIRGLNDQFAQNLLVMIDGRQVYTHVFSGVFWDIQDTVIEDIDRIEVIRGPGAALWGTNAVNGVINIITKKAEQTQGWQAIALGGSEEQSGSLRYGGTLENGAQYRTYGKFFNRGDLSDVGLDSLDETSDPNDAQSSDDWRSVRAGFRFDLEPDHGLAGTSPNTITLQGDAYANRYEKEFEHRSILFPGAVSNQSGRTETSKATGWHLLGRWQYNIAADSETILQVYYDRAKKDYDPGSGQVHTTDLDFQHRLPFGKRQEIIWGVAYKFIADEFDDSSNIQMDPSHLDQNQWSAFVQDEVMIVPDRLTFIAGSKFDYNEFTGLEVQPSLRALYTPDKRYSIWAAISRAVRMPSRLELHGRTSDLVDVPEIDPDDPVEVTTRGNSDLESEELTAFELGVRLTTPLRLRFDTTLFYNDYHDLIGLELDDNDPDDDRIDLGYANNRSGQAYGFELALDWKIYSNWMLGGSYSYLLTMIDENKVEDPSITALISQDSNPRHLFSVRSLLDISPQIDFDLWFRYVSRLPERDIDGYMVMDARIAWRLNADLELSLVGQNLLESGHSEFSSLEVERSIYAKIDWKF
ncbi:MAG: TonB-dependent receptor [Desulfobacteraceae bacterium]|jgi:iron complex outermembrane receptor protein